MHALNLEKVKKKTKLCYILDLQMREVGCLSGKCLSLLQTSLC